jgi:hypothetical protein
MSRMSLTCRVDLDGMIPRREVSAMYARVARNPGRYGVMGVNLWTIQAHS